VLAEARLYERAVGLLVGTRSVTLSLRLPTAASVKESENKQEYYRTHGGADDGRDNSGTKMDAQTRQQPASNKSADDSDCDIGNQAKSSPSHDLPCQPSGDQTH
jgi:hypothetical protein